MNRAEQGIPASNRRPQLWLALFLFALFAALLAQFYRIQVIQADYWKGVADRQHHFWVREPFMRGTFLADERRLALDIEKYHLFVDPQAISEDLRTELAQELTRRFGLNEGWVMEQLEKRSRSRHVCSWLDREQRADLLQWWHPWARAHRV
ncbi:MAG: hypothetical protein KDK78_02970, partial [Chlamydiia bacterium]|nr:hypothetical protein [Chlamydiia bacterium]